MLGSAGPLALYPAGQGRSTVGLTDSYMAQPRASEVLRLSGSVEMYRHNSPQPGLLKVVVVLVVCLCLGKVIKTYGVPKLYSQSAKKIHMKGSF